MSSVTHRAARYDHVSSRVVQAHHVLEHTLQREALPHVVRCGLTHAAAQPIVIQQGDAGFGYAKYGMVGRNESGPPRIERLWGASGRRRDDRHPDGLSLDENIRKTFH